MQSLMVLQELARYILTRSGIKPPEATADECAHYIVEFGEKLKKGQVYELENAEND